MYTGENPDCGQHKLYVTNFITAGTERKIPVVVMNTPLISGFEDYPFSYVNDYIKDIVSSNYTIYIDLLPYFPEYDSEELRVSFLDGHMNVWAHRITAEILSTVLHEKTILQKVNPKNHTTNCKM